MGATALASGISVFGVAGAAQAVQDRWTWCRKCYQLYHAPSGATGCAFDEEHDNSHSGNYTIKFESDGGPGQTGWRYCQFCNCMWFAGNGRLGHCWVGGEHSFSGSGRYLLTKKENHEGGQPNWFWCHKCEVLHFPDSNGVTGACPKEGHHFVLGSGNYVLRCC
jgi:hypothetical protein